MQEQEPKLPKLTKKWDPKEWRPEYDRVVGWSFLGASNVEVARKVGLTKEHVSNILTSDKGKEVMKILMAKQRETTEKTIVERLNDVAEKFTKRLEVFVDDDELYTKSPFAVIDRGLRVLEGTRNLKDKSTPDFAQQNNFFNIPPELQQTLIAGLEKANKVKELHGNKDLNRDISGLGSAGLIEAPKKNSDAA